MSDKIYFISDCHLNPDNPGLTELFLQFLNTEARTASALYVLGDLFNVWVGDDVRSPFVDTIQSALRSLSDRGIKIYFIRGNRDFLMGKSFCHATGGTLLKDPTCLTLQGTPTLLTHGDLLCTNDRQYQRYRKIVHHPFIQWFFLSFPIKLRQRIAEGLRAKSKAYQKEVSPMLTNVSQKTVEDTFARFNVTQIIHGHTHRPKQHTFTLHGKTFNRFVLGEWSLRSAKILKVEEGVCQIVDLVTSETLINEKLF